MIQKELEVISTSPSHVSAQSSYLVQWGRTISRKRDGMKTTSVGNVMIFELILDFQGEGMSE